jgi:hypothetical protein
MTNQPLWASGSAEILKHGLELLKKDTDSNRRLAMISIDNAVELMIKTYLGLPKRVTGLSISRSEYQEFAENFTKLLDALEKYASTKLDGVDLGEIEWFHRLRNQLYHQGNGLTVERDKVEVYAELSNVLFKNLFGFRLVEPESSDTALLGEFMQAWVSFERLLTDIASMPQFEDTRTSGRVVIPMRVLEALQKEGYLSKVQFKEINNIRDIRNKVAHGVVNYKDVIEPETVKRLVSITSELQNLIQEKRSGETS